MDITSYHLDHQDRIRVVDKASGNDWGGTRVNEKFMQFLELLANLWAVFTCFYASIHAILEL